MTYSSYLMIKNSVRLRIVIRRCMEDNLNVPIQEMSSFIGRTKETHIFR